MRYVVVLLVSVMLLTTSASSAQSKSKARKKFQYEEVDFENMMRRYFQKETSSPIEGIYSVSCVITRKSKAFLSGRERIKTMERKDNYARIAILKDLPGSKRDFIEVSLNYRDAKKYPIVGEMNNFGEGRALIYNHTEPDGNVITFSMISESVDLLEGEFSHMQKRKTITYKLSYLKIFPKNTAVAATD